MSPEQATGQRTLDARTDQYSLACVVYEMLAGEAPLTGPTVQAIIAKLMTECPVRLRTVRDTVPAAVDEAVARGLAKVPADRFGSVDAFVTALTAPAPVARRWTWKPLALAAGVGGMVRRWNRRPPPRASSAAVGCVRQRFGQSFLSCPEMGAAFCEADPSLQVFPLETLGTEAIYRIGRNGGRPPDHQPRRGTR